jgi:hypothetical protein
MGGLTFVLELPDPAQAPVPVPEKGQQYGPALVEVQRVPDSQQPLPQHVEL